MGDFSSNTLFNDWLSCSRCNVKSSIWDFIHSLLHKSARTCQRKHDSGQNTHTVSRQCKRCPRTFSKSHLRPRESSANTQTLCDCEIEVSTPRSRSVALSHHAESTCSIFALHNADIYSSLYSGISYKDCTLTLAYGTTRLSGVQRKRTPR